MHSNTVINILDMLDSIGEDAVKEIISDFSCPLNNEIEYFLFNNAIDFAKRKMSVTYLVFDEINRLTGYFTLTHKTALVAQSSLSKTGQKKMSMHARLDENLCGYDVSAFLIAQFGKNYAVENGSSISGDSLMDEVFDVLTEAQHIVGGGVAFLECENNDKLLSFYQNDNNRFRLYGERKSEKEGKVYLQLLRFF